MHTKRQKTTAVLLLRLTAAFLLTFMTYHPWHKSVPSVSHELMTNDLSLAWKVLIGVVVAAAHIAFLVAAYKSYGKLGMFLFAVLAGAIAWVAIQEGMITMASTSIQTALLITYSVFIGVGAAGAIIWRKFTGQLVTDEAPNVTEI